MCWTWRGGRAGVFRVDFFFFGAHFHIRKSILLIHQTQHGREKRYQNETSSKWKPFLHRSESHLSTPVKEFSSFINHTFLTLERLRPNFQRVFGWWKFSWGKTRPSLNFFFVFMLFRWQRVMMSWTCLNDPRERRNVSLSTRSSLAMALESHVLGRVWREGHGGAKAKVSRASERLSAALMRFLSRLCWALLCVVNSHSLTPILFFSFFLFNIFCIIFLFFFGVLCSEFRYFEAPTFVSLRASLVDIVQVPRKCMPANETLRERKSHSLVSCWAVQTWILHCHRVFFLFSFNCSSSHLNFFFYYSNFNTKLSEWVIVSGVHELKKTCIKVWLFSMCNEW